MERMEIDVFNKIILLRVLLSDIEIIMIIICDGNIFHLAAIGLSEFHGSSLNMIPKYFRILYICICEHFMRKPLLHSNYKRLISMLTHKKKRNDSQNCESIQSCS